MFCCQCPFHKFLQVTWCQAQEPSLVGGPYRHPCTRQEAVVSLIRCLLRICLLQRSRPSKRDGDCITNPAESCQSMCPACSETCPECTRKLPWACMVSVSMYGACRSKGSRSDSAGPSCSHVANARWPVYAGAGSVCTGGELPFDKSTLAVFLHGLLSRLFITLPCPVNIALDLSACIAACRIWFTAAHALHTLMSCV